MDPYTEGFVTCIVLSVTVALVNMPLECTHVNTSGSLIITDSAESKCDNGGILALFYGFLCRYFSKIHSQICKLPY